LRRVYSEIEDLIGLKRGEIRIACSQAVARNFLLEQILAFNKLHPAVVFRVLVTDHQSAMQSLATYESDLVLVFRPSRSAELQTILTVGQGINAVMAADHPLANQETLRIRECAEFDVALPERNFGGREIIEDCLATCSAKLNVVLEANSFDMLGDFVARTQAITFQIDIGTLLWKSDPRFAVRPLAEKEAATGPLVLGQFKGRALPLAPAKFAEQLCRALDELHSTPMKADAL
jgi:DNA-binding transcriptional LysR family regulator